MKKNTACACCMAVLIILTSCTFDYGDTESSDNSMPDLVMQNVEYVRVRSTEPIARIQAERVERYENQGLILLENFTFEQYGNSGETVNVAGSAGNASVQIESGDIFMDNGVWLEVESEDLIIETNQISWTDGERTMSSGKEDTVNIFKDNGTAISGTGLHADARRRSWEFTGAVSGTYVHEDNEE